MSNPETPQAWAIRITHILNAAFSEDERFPIDVKSIASEFSRQFFPDEPITMIEGNDFRKGIEGMLMPNPNKIGEWGIIYNQAISSKGRVNFTLAHEFGHYLLHRKLRSSGIECAPRDMACWNPDEGKIESEANCFASYLLMPLDDFRKQMSGEDISIALMQHLADRYAVSLTAAILKWLSITDKRAMIVVGREGFIDWAWSSQPLLKSSVFYRARQQVTPLPEQSLAAFADPFKDNATGIIHPKGVWLGEEEVHEMTILAYGGDMTISLLLYPDNAPNQWGEFDEEKTPNSYDHFQGLASR